MQGGIALAHAKPRKKSNAVVGYVIWGLVAFLISYAIAPWLFGIVFVIGIIVAIVAIAVHVSRKKEASSEAECTEDGSFPDEPLSLATQGDISIKPTTAHKAEAYADFIPVAERIKTAYESSYGLYPHEILALDYAHTFYTDQDSFQGWWYSYGVKDVRVVLADLLDRGYLQIGDLRPTLEKATATEIKEALKAFGIKATGKKADLIQRALDEVPEDELGQWFPRRTYELTESGKFALEESAYIPYIHRHGVEGLGIWSLNKLYHTRPDKAFSYRDVIWGYLNEQCGRHYLKHKYDLYRKCRLSMAQFLLEEDKSRQALQMLADVLLFDLHEWVLEPQFFADNAAYLFPGNENVMVLAPVVIGLIGECQDRLKYSDEEFEAILVECIGKASRPPIQVFTSEECGKIFFLERDENVDGLMKLYDKAKRAFRKTYPQIKI